MGHETRCLGREGRKNTSTALVFWNIGSICREYGTMKYRELGLEIKSCMGVIWYWVTITGAEQFTILLSDAWGPFGSSRGLGRCGKYDKRENMCTVYIQD